MNFAVVLVNVSRRSNQIQFPIGLSVVVNALKKNDINPQVIDLVPYPENQRENIFKEAIPYFPAIYGFGVMIGNSHLEEVENYVKLIRKRNPKNIVVYGGHFPSSIPELMLERCSCDYLVHGEGEKSFPALVQSIRESNYTPEDITGIFFRHNGTIKGNRNKRILKLGVLSNPDFSLFDMDYYINYLRETGQSWELMASRGCYGNCSFCYKFMGNGLSFRNVDYVLDEIEYIIKNYDFSRFYFVDENFLQVKKYFKEFIEKKNKRGLNFTFIGQSRIDVIDDEICKIGGENGLTCISSGIESVSQKTLDLINKKLKLNEVEEKIALMRNYNIRPMVNFIIGFPWDIEQDYFDLYNYIERNKLQKLTRLSYLTPLPSTRLFKEVYEKGLIPDIFEYCRKLDNLYWERHINLTQLPDSVIDYHFKRITELGRRDLFEMKSHKYVKEIRNERFI